MSVALAVTLLEILKHLISSQLSARWLFPGPFFRLLHTHAVHFIEVVVAQDLGLCFHSLNTLPC